MIVVPIPIDSETAQVYEEARSVLGSFVNRLISIIQNIIDQVVRLSRQIIEYASEHPLALTLLVANVMIWIS